MACKARYGKVFMSSLIKLLVAAAQLQRRYSSHVRRERGQLPDPAVDAAKLDTAVSLCDSALRSVNDNRSLGERGRRLLLVSEGRFRGH